MTLRPPAFPIRDAPRALLAVRTLGLILAVGGGVLAATAMFLPWSVALPTGTVGYAMTLDVQGRPIFASTTLASTIGARPPLGTPEAAAHLSTATESTLAHSDGAQAVVSAWPNTPLIVGVVAVVLAGIAAALALAVGGTAWVIALSAGAGALGVALLVEGAVNVIGLAAVAQGDDGFTLGLGAGGGLGLLGAALSALGATAALLSTPQRARP